MVNQEEILATVHKNFDHVDDLGNSILRAERRHDGKPYAVTYIDLADDVVARADELSAFQERLLGSQFFSANNDLRWNSYLYFLAGPNSIKHAAFPAAKQRIERDRHFTRKFVVSEQDLALQLGTASSPGPSAASVQPDAAALWSDLLRTNDLGVLLEQRPRIRALEMIASGAAFQAEARSTIPLPSTDDLLQRGRLRALSIGYFRSVNTGKRFTFGDVNLIYGPNGTGKTSLLETVEAFYCGRVRRDPDALFSGLQGEVEIDGTRVEVTGTTTPAILKARNLNWYGRPDPQSAAISHGFTRFNFLDTDAAFRLSSTPDPAGIRDDLSRLLVGAETAKLWTYLLKLSEEVREKIRLHADRQPSLARQAELLDEEVKRLSNTPTDANGSAKSYYAHLSAMGATWQGKSPTLLLNRSDRDRLANLLKGVRQVLSVVNSTPVTLHVLQTSARHAEEAFQSAKALGATHSSHLKQIAKLQPVVAAKKQALETLERWRLYCYARVPQLTADLATIQGQIGPLAAALSQVPAESLVELPTTYENLPIEGAVQLAREHLEQAVGAERTATQAVEAEHKNIESLSELRRDLHNAALAVVHKSGDHTTCPVCRTNHGPSELLSRIALLLDSNANSQSGKTGPRQTLQDAKARLKQEQRHLDVLARLITYNKARESADVISCGALRKEALLNHSRLAALIHESTRLTGDLSGSHATIGFSWPEYGSLLRDATKYLPDGSPQTDLQTIDEAIAKQRRSMGEDVESIAQLRSNADLTIVQIGDRLIRAGLSPESSSAPSVAVTVLERFSIELHEATSFAEKAKNEIAIEPTTTFEALQSALDQAIALHDRALYAAQHEQTAQIELKNKAAELNGVKAIIALEDKSSTNYRRAHVVLDKLVTEHSLDRATKDALKAIRDTVSDVFARIHSPHEYELGDFEHGMLLIKRNDKQPHGIDHISTGQRAAFALSIFLALNGSARTAPPVVLIDDPIAHIDDLNALSFVDYLRDLAMNSQRQIFFATADVRLAALFQRKFAFLGPTRFREISLSRT